MTPFWLLVIALILTWITLNEGRGLNWAVQVTLCWVLALAAVLWEALR